MELKQQSMELNNIKNLVEAESTINGTNLVTLYIPSNTNL